MEGTCARISSSVNTSDVDRVSPPISEVAGWTSSVTAGGLPQRGRATELDKLPANVLVRGELDLWCKQSC